MEAFLNSPEAFVGACEFALKTPQIQLLLKEALGVQELVGGEVKTLKEQLAATTSEAESAKKELESYRSQVRSLQDKVKELEMRLLPTESLAKLSLVAN